MNLVLKKCSNCNNYKQLSEYYIRKNIGYYSMCKKCFNFISSNYYNNNKEKVNKKQKEYYNNKKKDITIKQKKYVEKNKDKRNEYLQFYREYNKDKLNLYNRNWGKKKRKEDPKYKIRHNISSAIWRSIKGNKSASILNILNYTIDELILHLEKQFKPGMSWENYGEWHIDHIIPVSSFEFESVDDLDFKMCWALNNLQPLWAKDNLMKQAKL